MMFTVVVPAYGSAPYLPSLFASLDAQTCRDFEVVFAVERSPDESLALCQGWRPRDGIRVTVLDLPKTGAGGASRNRAFGIARGRYVVPLDGDDWLDAEALTVLAERLEAADFPEVANVTARVVADDGRNNLEPAGDISNLPPSEDGLLVSGVEFLRRVGRRGHCKNHGALVVARTDFLRERKLYQLECIPSEDSEWTPRVLLCAERVLFLAEPHYNYRRREGSVSSAGSNRILFATAEICLRLASFFSKMDIPADVRRSLENDALSIFNWYLFNRTYARRFSRSDRLAALAIVFADAKTKTLYRSLWRSASRWKRLAWPLVVFAWRTGVIFPATWYFRYFYYPMSGMVRR
ncbi:MAG: glycosyltransferase [Kiritimatiellae bacterium]|nr:glycosyltransferase [Kiritimatiellia bacterium]